MNKGVIIYKLSFLNILRVIYLYLFVGVNHFYALKPFFIFRAIKVAKDDALDEVIVTDGFPQIVRNFDGYSNNNFCIYPFNIFEHLRCNRFATKSEIIWGQAHNFDANYLARSNLSGHFIEFGVLWGKSFLESYFRLRDILTDGMFFAFDSFSGLSKPEILEEVYSGGDFREGNYCFNQKSFEKICSIAGVVDSRLKIVPGFFDDTLILSGENYGIMPKSVSVARIDVDLYSPTFRVLDFIKPLMEDGGLLYFDDWRLSRASPTSGERGAALEWLSRNNDISLTPCASEDWQNQWFIFHRVEIGKNSGISL